MLQRFLPLAWLMLTWALSSVALADTPPDSRPQAFSASYHLNISGWPNADISHRLTQTGAEDWRITMQARIAIASGQETGHFRFDAEGLHPRDYDSNYRLAGIKRSYALDSDKLGHIPDRQSAIVALAMSAAGGSCQQDCPVHYRDHRGRDKAMVYRLLPSAPMQAAGQTVQAIRLELIEPDEPEKRIVMALHPELPGLLLKVEYFRNGKRKSQLSLTSLAIY